MSKKPRKKGSYTVRGLGGGTGIGIAVGVALYSSGVRWGISIGIVLCAGIGGILGNLGCTSQGILEGNLNTPNSHSLQKKVSFVSHKVILSDG